MLNSQQSKYKRTIEKKNQSTEKIKNKWANPDKSTKPHKLY